MTTDEIKEFFKNDRFADGIGAVIDSISKDEVVCSLELSDRHLNAGGKVQGGAIFTLADFTLAVAANYDILTENKKSIAVNQSCNILFIKPAAGKRLISKSKRIQSGKRLSVFRMTVTDDEGTCIAEMTANSYTVSLEKN